MAPRPYFLMARGETGLETLMDSRQIKDVDHYPELMKWNTVLDVVDMLATEEHKFGTLVMDALGGFERLCHEYVCKRDFCSAERPDGDWGDKGFQGYMRGYDIALADWRTLLSKLDTLREKKRMAIIVIAHTKVTAFKNPEGLDYDRYEPDMHRKTWGLTHKWADIVLFANYLTVVDDKATISKTTGKGKGGTSRVLYTERTAAYDAKNRCGLHDEIDMGSSAAEAWTNFITAIKTAKEANNG